MPCDKCFGRRQEKDDQQLNEIRFDEDSPTFVVCDHCASRCYDYLKDFF